jgi:hypothetical protein
VWGLALIAAGAAATSRRWLAILCIALCFTALPDPLKNDPGGVALRLGLLAVAGAGWFVSRRALPVREGTA